MSESAQPLGGGSEFATPCDASTTRITVGSDGVIRSWNQAAETLSGYSPGEAVGHPLFEVLVAPAPPAERATLLAHLATGRPLKVSVQGRGGRELLLRTEVPPPPGAHCLDDFSAPLREVTLSAAAVDRATTSEQVDALAGRLRELLEALPDAMLIVDDRGRIVLINRSAEALFGAEHQELVGKTIEDLVPGLSRLQPAGHLADSSADPRQRQMASGLELHARRRDGSSFPAEISLSLLTAGEGTFVIAAIRDIGKRRTIETKFRALLEAAPDAMVIVNRQGAIELVNGQAEELFGYGRAELLGQPIEVLLPERYHGVHAVHRQRFSSAPWVRSMGCGIELLGRHRNGREFPVEVSLAPIETEEGILVASAIRDTTERRRLEDLRRHGLEEASRLKSEFLANMSHELRTPLNAILGFAELMHDGKAGPVNADQKEYLGDVLTSSRHLLGLINDVLDLSKIEAGRIEFAAEPVDVEKIAAEVRDTLRSLGDSRRIAISIEADPAVGPVTTDPGRLKQVLYNYLSNALKFTPEGGRITLRIGSEDDGHFRLEIEDQGIGIKPEDQERLFVEFEQLDASVAKKYGGTGLGLALTRRIVEAQGGRVGVESQPGRGSRFFAILPRQATTASLPPLPVPSRGASVLIVEDDPQDRAVLAHGLTAAGFAVETVGTGAAAIERCRGRALAAVLLDLILPDLPGIDVLKDIRGATAHRRAPIIAISGTPAETAADWPLDAFVAKPIRIEDVLATLARAGIVPAPGPNPRGDLVP